MLEYATTMKTIRSLRLWQKFKQLTNTFGAWSSVSGVTVTLVTTDSVYTRRVCCTSAIAISTFVYVYITEQ